MGQHGKGVLGSTAARVDRIAVVKNSIDVPVWHEKSFWPLYEKYLSKDQDASALAYRALYDLANTGKNESETEAYENGRKLIDYRYAELAIRKDYFAQMGAALNGIIALQFAQTEALIDMVESSRIYEDTEWKKFRFHGHAMLPEKMLQAKHNIMKAALDLSPEEAGKFWKIYLRYEGECDDLLGEGYTIFSVFAGEASDFTPALAKRLGYDFLGVTEREMKLKEKYFTEMNNTINSSVAARFLAWEDYYSLISKMYVWADEP
jgi:hypothetical protein